MSILKPSRSEFVDLPDLKIHVRRWGHPGAPRLFLLHGWMDCSATFQFMVDALEDEWDIVAPDWRGFGQSGWQNSTYWMPQYAVDLEFLLNHYSPDQPATVIGHSLGGNVTSMVAALRPERIARFVNLDAFGTGLYTAEDLPDRLAAWMTEKAHGLKLHPGYDSIDAFTQRLQANNPRLTQAQAAFLAENFSRRNDHGRLVPAADPWHRLHSPPTLSGDDYKRLWRRISAKVLMVVAKESFLLKRFDPYQDEYRARLACFSDLRLVTLPDAAHNLQHDQPRQLARVIEDFLRESA